MLLCLAGCNLAAETASIVPPPPQIVASLVPAPQTSSGSPVLSDEWQQAAVGMEVRQFVPFSDVLKTLVAVRLDPNVYTFRAHYRPGQPMTLKQWQELLPDARLIINANFFHPDNTVVGMVVTDEGLFGETLVNRGGMFSIENGLPVLQSLVEYPYNGRWLDQAVQGFPNLMSGGFASMSNSNENRASRRTVVAMDAAGRIVILSTPLFGIGLYDLSQYLAASDLQLINAVNLDGGGSTMLNIVPINYQVLSFDPVPAVLAVYAR
jgi:hypothetical protein